MQLRDPLTAICRAMDAPGSLPEKKWVQLSPVLQKAGDDWHAAVLSDCTTDTLRRYFRQEALALVTLSEMENPGPLGELICDLCDLLYSVFRFYLDPEVSAPVCWSKQLITAASADIKLIRNTLKLAGIPPGARLALEDYFSEFTGEDHHRFNYGQLCYFRELTRSLGEWVGSTDGAEALQRLLRQHDFNHLEVFRWLHNTIEAETDQISDKLKKRVFLMEQAWQFRESTHQSCYPAWPPLAVMIGEWIKEEIVLLQSSADHVDTCTEKLQISVPVSQLACILKEFYDAGFFPATTFSEVLRFFSGKCSTKRQAVISFGSLSKESYTTTQFTASRVRGFFLDLAGNINRHYFP